MNKPVKWYQHIPNILTLINLCSGFLSIVFLFYKNLEAAALMILVGALFDFLDGLAARLLNARSDTGKILDSLADIVTFGVAPAVIAFRIIELSFAQVIPDFDIYSATVGQKVLLFSPVIILVSAALRLADFTTGEYNKKFKGMPTPASGLLFAGMCFYLLDPEWQMMSGFLLNSYVILAILCITGFLMISRVSFISLKMKDLSFGTHIMQYLLLAGSIVLLIIFGKFAVSLIILFYVIVSIIDNIIPKHTEQ
ncbi:MAG: CDP-alcohol phosphatidyltransferase family protein [Bacteroidales bacterium]|nr:CDP-alcohol phosphatidyltransferase family protein [Bacteroidales bacterium]